MQNQWCSDAAGFLKNKRARKKEEKYGDLRGKKMIALLGPMRAMSKNLYKWIDEKNVINVRTGHV